MNKTSSRFSIKEKTVIEDKYVLYAENIKVSFKANKKKTSLRLGETIWELEKAQKHSSKSEEIKKRIDDLQNDINFLNSNGRLQVLKGVDLKLRQGETLSIVGANGAGKTVLMETILGLNKMDEGEVYLNLGHDTFYKNLKEIGIQYQQSKFSKGAKVNKTLDRYRNLYGRERTTDEQFNEMLEAFDIKPFFDRKIDDLSGGQRQRLNLMLSIMHNPKIMILDEFITGLDVRSVRKIISYVYDLKIKNKASMIIISHQPEEIESLSDRIVLLRDGRIVDETNIEQIKKSGLTVAQYVEENI